MYFDLLINTDVDNIFITKCYTVSPIKAKLIKKRCSIYKNYVLQWFKMEINYIYKKTSPYFYKHSGRLFVHFVKPKLLVKSYFIYLSMLTFKLLVANTNRHKQIQILPNDFITK